MENLKEPLKIGLGIDFPLIYMYNGIKVSLLIEGASSIQGILAPVERAKERGWSRAII